MYTENSIYLQLGHTLIAHCKQIGKLHTELSWDNFQL